MFFFLLPCFIEITVLHANNVHSDQTLRSVASDVRLHCLRMSLVWYSRHNWVKLPAVGIFFFDLCLVRCLVVPLVC